MLDLPLGPTFFARTLGSRLPSSKVSYVYLLLPWVFAFTVKYLLLPWGICFCREFLLLPWSICFCREFLLLPWSHCFCREVFAFAVRYFVFAVRFLVLPWGIFFLPWGFWFCREVFVFAVRVLVLPWQLWATVGTNSLERFLKKSSWYRETQRWIKKVMASLRCHGDSDCNKTQKFHLYTVVVIFFSYLYS